MSEFTPLASFLLKLDFELKNHAENERLETLDASLAANIVVARLKNLEGEIKDLDEMSGTEEAKERKSWCLEMQYKL